MGKHPKSTYLFVRLCDIAALLVVFNVLFRIHHYSLGVWVNFAVWTILLCVARLEGLFEFIGFKISVGWATSIELAAIIVLPFPLYGISIILSAIVIIIDRIRDKHPEPFLGPDFNASNNIFGAFFYKWSYEKMILLLGTSSLVSILSLLISSFLFAAVQIFFLTSLISVDEKKPWQQVGTLKFDSLINEMVLIITGALIGRVYTLDPFLIVLMLIPLLLLHKLLRNLDEVKLIYVDQKTGLYNYRYFDENLTELYNKASKDHLSLSLIFGDMDHLRDVNNTYGHPTGDEALITIAKIFKKICGSNLIPVRFGGEEFVVILPNHTKFQAALVAEQIRSTIESTPVDLDGGGHIRITMSFGVSNYPVDAATIEELIKTSDIAVYKAKHDGRNRVAIYDKNDIFPSLEGKKVDKEYEQ